jgi:hypothetical protein
MHKILLLCFSLIALFILEGCGESKVKSKKTILSSARFYRVELGKKFGYISEARVVIKPQFDDAKEFAEGLAAVKLGKKWGYIDRIGKHAPGILRVGKEEMPARRKTGQHYRDRN